MPTTDEAHATLEADELAHALWRLRGALSDARRALEEHPPAVGAAEREIARLGLQIVVDTLGMVDAALDTTP